jgi:hypothetical protein
LHNNYEYAKETLFSYFYHINHLKEILVEMFGFVKTGMKLQDNNSIDFRKEKQRKDRIFTIVYAIIAFAVLNLILYLMTRV